MLALRELQTAFRRALLEEDAQACALVGSVIVESGLPASERLAVYRNNVVASLTDTLRETFPVVCRLVDERFFFYAAREFMAVSPPSRPALFEYGEAFPAFLASFPPCRDLPYLPDVARFEWLMNAAAHASDAASVPAERLAGLAPQDAVRLVFEIHPSYGYLSSPFPVDRIWRANQPDAKDEAVDLDAGGLHLETSRRDDAVGFRRLDEATFAFRNALAARAPLGTALDLAFAVDANFPAGDALATLFGEGAIVAVTGLSPEEVQAS